MTKETPTLSINDLALLKTNPKKYYKKQLEKEDIIEADTVKHPVTEHARYVGSTGKVGEPYQQDGMALYDKVYKDGTKITYTMGEAEDWINPETGQVEIEDEYKNPTNNKVYSITTPEGETIPFLAAKHWKERQDTIGYEGSNVEEGVPDQFDYISEAFAGNGVYGAIPTISTAEDGGYRSNIPDAIRESVINGKSTNKIKENFEDGEYETELLGDQNFTKDELLDYALNDYNEAVKTNSFENADSFLTVETYGTSGLPTNEGIERGIVTNSDYRFEEATTYGFHMNDEWKVYTIREKGNPANCGVDLSKYAEPYYQEGPDSPGMFMTAPGQKTETLLVDEGTKTIIRKPYKPGMPRHIWG